MTSSVQLEREAEQTRSQLAQTLDELRRRITPAQLVDQAVDYAKDSGGGQFVRNLSRQATSNPMPVALIGAGMAWLMLSNDRQPSASRATSVDRASKNTDAAAQQRESSRQTNEQIKGSGQEADQRTRGWLSDAWDRLTDTRERFRDRAETTQSTAEEASQSVRARASDAAASVSDRAASVYEAAQSGVSETYERISDQAHQASSSTAEGALRFGQSTAGATRDFLQFCKTQPLVLAGLGMALGAIIGALIPPTEAEDQLMGKTSDQIKDQAGNIASDQIEAAKSAAISGLDEAEARLNPDDTGTSDVPAESSLVPDADDSFSDETAEQKRASLTSGAK
jgi:Protein of unknown function (DUF3618)